MSSKVNMISLCCQDPQLRVNFLSSIFSAFPSSQDQPMAKLSLELLSEVISKEDSSDIKRRRIKVNDFQFAFFVDHQERRIKDKEYHPKNYVFLFEVGSDLDAPFYAAFKDLGEKPNILIIICKPSSKIKDSTVNKYENEILEILDQSFEIRIQKDMIIHMCLSDPKPFGQSFENYLSKWQQLFPTTQNKEPANLKEAAVSAVNLIMQKFQVKSQEDCLEEIINENFQESKIYVGKAQRQKFFTQVKECQELKAYFNSLKPELSKQQTFQLNLKTALLDIITSYKLQKPEECLQQLLENHPEDAVILVEKKNRAKFLKAVQECQLYIKFVQSLTQDGLHLNNTPSIQDLKKQAEPFLRKLTEKYSIKMKDECIEEIFENNLEDAILRTKRQLRTVFQQEILACEKLVAYWKSKQNPIIENEEEKLRKVAEAKLHQLLETYGVHDIQELCKYILENRLEDAAIQIPSKQREKFRKECENCEALQQFRAYKKGQAQEKDLRQLAIEALDKLFQKYDVKKLKDAIEYILDDNLDDALLSIKANLRQAFKKDLAQLFPYQEYLKSLVQPNKADLLQKEAKGEMLMLLEMYDVMEPEEVIPDMMTGNIATALKQISSKKKPLFKQEFEKNEKIRLFLTSISETIEENLQQIASNALLAIISNFNAKNPKACLNELLQDNIEDAALSVNSRLRENFKEEVKTCQQYQRFLNSHKVKQQSDKDKAKKAVLIILEKYKIKHIEDCLEEIFSKNLQDASISTKRQQRQAFINELNLCLQLKRYWQSLDPPQEGDQLKKEAVQGVTKILKKYVVQDIQECLSKVLQCQLEEIKGEVISKKRESFINEFKNNDALKRYWESRKPQEPNIEEEARKALRVICQEYKVKNIQECINDCIAQNYEDASLKVNRLTRDSFLNAIKKSKQYAAFLQSNSQTIKIYKKAESSLLNIFKRYKIADLEECLHQVINNQLDDAALNVKSSVRADFLKEIKQCADFQAYLSSLVPEEKNATLKKNATTALKVILAKYVSDVEECIPFLLQNKINEVLKEVKATKRSQFEKQLERSIEYQNYLKSLKGDIDGKYLIVREELTALRFDKKRIIEIIEEFNKGKVQELKKILGPAKLYSVLDKLVEDNDFFKAINQHQIANCEHISYFYFFVKNVNQLSQVFQLMLALQPQKPINSQGIFIQKLSSADKNRQINIISQQIELLQELYTQAKTEKAKTLQEALQLIKTMLLNEKYKKAIKFLQQAEKINHINLSGLQKTISEKNELIAKTYEKTKKDEYKKQIIKIQNVLSVVNQKKNVQELLKIQDISQLLLKYISILNSDNITEGQLSQNAQKYKRQTSSSKNEQEYLQNKVLQIKYTVYQRFFSLYQKDLDLLMLKIEFEERIYKIIVENEIESGELYAKVCKEIGQAEVCIELNYPETKIILNKNNKEVYQKPNSIRCYKQIPINIQFRKRIIKINISKELSPQSLKYIVRYSLLEQNFDISIDQISLFGFFGEESEMVKIEEQIEVIEMNRLSKLKFISVTVKMCVIVYYEVDSYRFDLESDKNVEDLKQYIFEKSNIPIKSQSLLYAKQNSEEEVFTQKLDEIEPNSSNITFTLISKMNLEHYGFHENYSLIFDSYTDFFIEKANDMQDMVNSCTLKKQQEKNFFDQLIKFLYAAVKRRFPFTHITDQVKSKIVHKNSQQIWSGEDFSEYFLVYYILYNSDQKLRIELMNILRTFVPLPLFYREFQNINHIKNEWVINRELLWILHSGLCITSVGFHTENIAKEKGKTYLNNLLFFTTFQDESTKHPISYGCPEIVLKALGNIIPVNIIDAPSQTSTQILESLYSVTDLLIIHSWKGKEESEKMIERIKATYKIEHIICLLRDCKSKEETITKVKNAKLDQNCYVELHNLEDNKKKKKQSFIQILRQKIWETGSKALASQSKKQNNIYKLFKNKLFQDFSEKLKHLKEKFYEMKIIFTKYEKIKDLKKQNNIQSLNEADKLKAEAIKNEIAPEFKEILHFINKNKDFSEILMLRLREVLKEIKNEEERKYFIINQYKKKIALLAKDKKDDILKLIQQAALEISALPKMIKVDTKKTQAQMVEELSSIFEHFQNEIRSIFFTIELAWRELQYLTTLSSEVKLGDIFLINFLIDIKRIEISNSQPFELLDGDLLEMPKSIMKKVFEGITDRVAVITILGPQSSGKSTLLNFLFGCDFGTSQGRCTKGVYGTYFKFSNITLPNCEGVFLIDTEGLFATLNKKDATRRKDFDSKLVLFCLAVSDFVIINTKGNLDSESSKILKSSMDRFTALTEQNLEWPEIFLVLNQNNSSNINTSEGDINKLRDIFAVQNSQSLNQAYNLTQLTKKDIALLPQDENLVKRQPREEFLTLTNELQLSLINKIETIDAKPISVVIDLMERVWSTIEAFPDLGKTASKKIQQIENKIKEWRVEKIEKLTAKREEFFEQFKDNKINEKKCQSALLDEITNIQNEFKNTFLDEKNLELMAEDEKIKIQLEEKKIQLSFEAIKYELSLQIKDLEKSRLAEKSKSQGSEYEKQAIRIVKKIQREEKRALTNEEKQVYFSQAFNKSLQKIQLIAAPEQQLENYFERTYEFYASASSITSTNRSKGDVSKSAGLPRAEWKCDGKLDYPLFSQSIKAKIFNLIGKESNKYIESKKTPPTKVLDESARTDAKLQYFNMRNYFQKVKVSTFYEISLDQFKSCLKFDLLKQYISQMYTQKNKFENLIISRLFTLLNKLFQNYGFALDNIESFTNYLAYKNKFCTWLSSEPQLKIKFYQNQKNQKKLKKSNKKEKKSPAKYSRGYSSGYGNYPYSGHYSSTYPSSYQMHAIQIKEQYNELQQSEMQNEQSSSESDKNQYALIKDEQIKDFNIYVDINLLEKKIKEAHHFSINYSTIQFISKCLKDIIKWTAIQRQIEKSKEFDITKKEINKKIDLLLKTDLKQFGLTIECDDYYQYISHQRNVLKMDIKQLQEVKPNESESDFFKKLKRFDYFDDHKITQFLKKSVRNASSYYYIQLGSYQESTFEVMPEYRQTRELQTYISNDTSSVYVNLLSDTMKEFVYRELIKKKTFQTLFSKIDKIILKSSNYLNTSTITGIYIDVNREITEFNNDLNQVSHKLTLIFTGYVHLYAIYLTWKKFSVEALKIANKPYFDLLQTRENQLSFFINETSDNDNLRSVGQADRFLNEIVEYCKGIIKDHKKKVNDNEAKKFKKQYPRAVIQEKIDRESFDTASKPDDWINYLTNPAKVITEKYDSLIKLSVGDLQNQYRLCEKIEQLIKEFKQGIKSLLDRLKLEGLTQDTIHTEMVGLVKKTQKEISVSDNEVLDKVNALMMTFFLDLLVKDEKIIYKEAEFDLEIKEKSRGIKIHREPTPNFQQLIRKLRDHNLSITRFFTFVDIIHAKLSEKVEQGGVEFEKFSLQIKALLEMTSDDEKDYTSMVTVKICNQLCPGCQRICGVEEAHTNNHECKFGHQMRALGGVKLSNGDASVIRCEDVQLMSQIEFNGKRMTWKEFKEYWEGKSEGSWSFADLAHDKYKEIFVKAWDITGKTICQRFQMNYVQSNALDAQKVAMSTKTEPTHYIFALDDSGSMGGQKWTDLMISYKTAIEAIRKISGSETSIRVSVLIEGSTCLLHQQNSTPSGVNLTVNPRMGGNNFVDTFGKAYNLMTKYVGGAKIKYIFMTDGGDSYPSAQVANIKKLKASYTGKIEYYGIEFQTNGNVMKIICQQLGGSNKISHNVSQLTSAYLEIINRNI